MYIPKNKQNCFCQNLGRETAPTPPNASHRWSQAVLCAGEGQQAGGWCHCHRKVYICQRWADWQRSVHHSLPVDGLLGYTVQGQWSLMCHCLCRTKRLCFIRVSVCLSVCLFVSMLDWLATFRLYFIVTCLSAVYWAMLYKAIERFTVTLTVIMFCFYRQTVVDDADKAVKDVYSSISELRSVTCHMGSHSVTCVTWHRWTCLALTPARQAGTRYGSESE